MIDQPHSDRAKLMLAWPVAGFFVVVAFWIAWTPQVAAVQGWMERGGWKVRS